MFVLRGGDCTPRIFRRLGLALVVFRLRLSVFSLFGMSWAAGVLAHNACGSPPKMFLDLFPSLSEEDLAEERCVWSVEIAGELSKSLGLRGFECQRRTIGE